MTRRRVRAIPRLLRLVAMQSEYRLTGRELLQALAIAQGWRKPEEATCPTR